MKSLSPSVFVHAARLPRRIYCTAVDAPQSKRRGRGAAVDAPRSIRRSAGHPAEVSQVQSPPFVAHFGFTVCCHG